MKTIQCVILAASALLATAVADSASAQEQAPLLAEGSVAASAPVPASSGDKPVPLPPYLAPVPEYGRWKVTFKYEEAVPAPDAEGDGTGAKPAALPDASPSQIETIKAGEQRSVSLTFVRGAPRQYNCQGDWVLWSTARGAKLIIADPAHVPYMYYTQGYALMEGVTIGAATYQGVEDYNGVQAFHYKSGETDVWIDVATMLPAGVKKGGVEAVYQFLSTSKKLTLNIPQDQAELLQKGLEADRYVRSLR